MSIKGVRYGKCSRCKRSQQGALYRQHNVWLCWRCYGSPIEKVFWTDLLKTARKLVHPLPITTIE